MTKLTAEDKMGIGLTISIFPFMLIASYFNESKFGDEVSQSLKLQEIMKKTKKLQNSTTATRLRSVGQYTVTHKP